jgi:hypothetical protein
VQKLRSKPLLSPAEQTFPYRSAEDSQALVIAEGSITIAEQQLLESKRKIVATLQHRHRLG